MPAQVLPRHVCQEMRGQVSYLEDQFQRQENEAREILRSGWAEALDRGERFPARWLNNKALAFIVRIAGFEDIYQAATWLRRGASQ